ncbi:hypothetical protein ABPG72_016051 [Tetrahymena utriculariae]
MEKSITGTLIADPNGRVIKAIDKKQPLKDAIQQSKALLSNLITLSEAIKKYPQCADEFKIRLVQKQVKEIDKVPTFYKKIDTLYISNNSIKTLDGIEQFTHLQHLSISNNNLKDISIIKLIRKLDNLESLNMSGNPVTKHPIYRQLILTTLPNLQQLDGKVVTKEDKQIAEVQLKKQNSLLDLILNNYIEIRKLNYISKKLDLHQQLGQHHFQFINYHPQFQNMSVNLQQIKKQYDFQSHFPQFVKEEMIDNIMSDILTLYESLNQLQGEQEQNYEKAFTELLMKQQQLMAQLNIQCQQQVDKLNSLKANIKVKHKEQPFASSQHSQFNSTQRSQQFQDQQQNIYSPKVTKEEIRTKSPQQEQEYNQNTLYYRSLQKSLKGQKKLEEDNQKQKTQSTKRSQSPNRTIPVPLSQEGIPTSSKKNTQKARKQQIQEQDLNSSKKSTENIAFQQSSFNRNYHKQNLNQDCCRKYMNQDEHSLEEFKKSQSSHSPYRQTNNDLKGIINDLNQVVQQKEDELKELQFINQKILDEQQEKDNEKIELLDFAQRRIQDMQDREIGQNEIEFEIQELRQQINQLMQKNVDLEKEAQEKQELERQIMFKEGQIQELDYRNQIEEKAENFNELRLKKLFMKYLGFAVQTEKRIQQFREKKLQEQADHLQSEYFRAWLRRVIVKKFEKAYIYEQKCTLQKKMLTNWRKNIIFQQRLSIMKEKSNSPEKKDLTHLKVSLILVNAKNIQDISTNSFVRFKNLIFKRWKQIYLKNRTSKVEFQALVRHNCLKSMFKQWRNSFLDNRNSKKQTLKVLTYLRKKIQAKYFQAIKQYRKSKIEEKAKYDQVQKINQFNFYKHCFKQWYLRMIPLTAARQQQVKNKANQMAKCFYQIKNYAKRSIKKKFNQINLDNYLDFKQKKILFQNFNAFKKHTQQEIRLKKIVINFRINQKFKIYRIFLNALARENILKQKQILYQMNHELKLNETNINSSSEVIRSYENEKQNLIYEINQLKEENFGQKLAIEEFQQIQIKYNSQLRSIERQEKIFKEEKEAYEIRIRDYEELLKQIHSEYQKQIQQKDIEIHESKNETRAVQKQISILQRELEFKQNTILETEKALLNRGEQSSILLRETEKKLQNSIMMANEFKTKIEELYSENEELKGQVYGKDLDIEQLKSKLKESLDLIRESSDMYDQKINDFNAIIESKNTQIQEFVDKQIRFQQQINELQQELRKQHLELELFQQMQPMLEHPQVNQYYQEYQDLQNELDAYRNNLKKRMEKLNRSINQIQDIDRRVKNQTLREYNQQHERTSPLYSRQASPMSERKIKEQEVAGNIVRNSGISTIKSYLPQTEMQVNFRSVDTFSNFHNQSYHNTYNLHSVEDVHSAPAQRIHTDPSNTREAHQQLERNTLTRASYEPYNHFGEDNFATYENCETTEQIHEELERNRANRRLFKQNIERRISRLETNIDRDLAQNERSKSRSQSPEICYRQN